MSVSVSGGRLGNRTLSARKGCTPFQGAALPSCPSSIMSRVERKTRESNSVNLSAVRFSRPLHYHPARLPHYPGASIDYGGRLGDRTLSALCEAVQISNLLHYRPAHLPSQSIDFNHLLKTKTRPNISVGRGKI